MLPKGTSGPRADGATRLEAAACPATASRSESRRHEPRPRPLRPRGPGLPKESSGGAGASESRRRPWPLLHGCVRPRHGVGVSAPGWLPSQQRGCVRVRCASSAVRAGMSAARWAGQLRRAQACQKQRRIQPRAAEWTRAASLRNGVSALPLAPAAHLRLWQSVRPRRPPTVQSARHLGGMGRRRRRSLRASLLRHRGGLLPGGQHRGPRSAGNAGPLLGQRRARRLPPSRGAARPRGWGRGACARPARARRAEKQGVRGSRKRAGISEQRPPRSPPRRPAGHRALGAAGASYGTARAGSAPAARMRVVGWWPNELRPRPMTGMPRSAGS